MIVMNHSIFILWKQIHYYTTGITTPSPDIHPCYRLLMSWSHGSSTAEAPLHSSRISEKKSSCSDISLWWTRIFSELQPKHLESCSQSVTSLSVGLDSKIGCYSQSNKQIHQPFFGTDVSCHTPFVWCLENISKLKCHFTQWTMDSHSFNGVPRDALRTIFHAAPPFSDLCLIIGCHPVSLFNLQPMTLCNSIAEKLWFSTSCNCNDIIKSLNKHLFRSVPQSIKLHCQCSKVAIVHCNWEQSNNMKH